MPERSVCRPVELSNSLSALHAATLAGLALQTPTVVSATHSSGGTRPFRQSLAMAINGLKRIPNNSPPPADPMIGLVQIRSKRDKCCKESDETTLPWREEAIHKHGRQVLIEGKRMDSAATGTIDEPATCSSWYQATVRRSPSESNVGCTSGKRSMSRWLSAWE